MENVKKNDFVEIKFTGYSNGQIFDSNIEEDLKKINPEAKPLQVIVSIGHGMVVSGLDKALEGKEIGKDYEIKIPAKEGFGERDRNLMKTIPLRMFTEKNIAPRPGMVLSLDDMVVKIVTVSGARVITDFNNPLAGKELSYKFRITRKVDDEQEKCRAVFMVVMKFVPEFEIKDKVVIKGPKGIEVIVKAYGDKFKEIVGKELAFEIVEKKENKPIEIKESDKKEA